MQITSEHTISAPAELLWDLMNDVERVAPFVPGFTLEEGAGDRYRGTVKVKVGAVTVSYATNIEIVDRDFDARRITMMVTGAELRGPGTMKAEVVSELRPEHDGTRIHLVTELQVTGRVAQFGRGILAEVSSDLLAKFVKALEARALAPARTQALEDTSPPVESGRSNEVVDLTRVAGKSALKRIAPVLAVLVVVVAYLVLRN